MNVGEHRPLAEFLGLGVALALLVAAAALLLLLFVQAVARLVPFDVELRMAENRLPSFASTPRHLEIERYLQALAARVIAVQPLPEGMQVRVRYHPGGLPNAFATLGGNVVVHQGLIDALASENALAMVIAHEIAHVRHRDPVVGLGRGVALALLIGAVSSAAGGRLADLAIGQGGMLTALRFSRAQEIRADADALAAVAALYGHVGGATGFFEAMLARRGAPGEPPEWLRTHPATDHRVAELARIARERGWSTDGERTPLPQWLLARPAPDAGG